MSKYNKLPRVWFNGIPYTFHKSRRMLIAVDDGRDVVKLDAIATGHVALLVDVLGPSNIPVSLASYHVG